jgi:hypothetical protein
VADKTLAEGGAVQLTAEEVHPEEQGFPWPAGDASSPPADHIPGQLPSSGPIAQFARDALQLARPDALMPDRAWVLARGARVIKLYDLHDGGTHSAYRSAEADIALYLSTIPGVIRTLRAQELDGWLVIEMERGGDGLDRHIAEVKTGRRLPLAATRYAELFHRVAETLQQVGDRGMVHRDIKPANLLFDSDEQRLLVADFSVTSPFAKRRRNPLAENREGPLGTDRYIAPEQFVGSVTPAADQYSLGVTALDTFALLAPDPAVDAVLARATAHRPQDRFDSLTEFGNALRTAAAGRPSGRVSDRLERVGAVWRQTWGPALLAAFLIYLALLILPATHPHALRLLAVPAVGLGVALAVRILSLLHGSRTQPRLALANQVWFAPLLAAPLLALVFATQPKDVHVFVDRALPLVGVAYGFTAWLGSTPVRAGRWLIAPLRRLESRPRRLVVLYSMLLAIVLVLATWLPGVVYRTGRTFSALPTQPAQKVGYMRVIDQFRAQLLSGDPAAACDFVRAPPDGYERCSAWVGDAAQDLRSDLTATGDRNAFLGAAPLSAFTVQSQQDTQLPGVSVLANSGGAAVAFGTFTAPSVIEVQLPRPTANGQEGLWTYELSDRAGRWEITGVSACSQVSSADCTYFTSLHPG